MWKTSKNFHERVQKKGGYWIPTMKTECLCIHTEIFDVGSSSILQLFIFVSFVEDEKFSTCIFQLTLYYTILTVFTKLFLYTNFNVSMVLKTNVQYQLVLQNLYFHFYAIFKSLFASLPLFSSFSDRVFCISLRRHKTIFYLYFAKSEQEDQRNLRKIPSTFTS